MAFVPSLSVLTSVYRGEEYLPGFFENLRAQTVFPELELILVLNDPSMREKTLAKDFALRHSERVHTLFPPRLETLGASWNRAWQATKAPYLAIWNVDDRRLIDSLQCQLAALKQHPEAALCYADYIAVENYGEEEGARRHTPAFRINHFRRAFAQGGAFWLLRSSVSEQIGFFDEQFRIGPDMEYSFRIAVRGLTMVRAEGLAGYFTNAAKGLSTCQGASDSAVERTAIQLRYGVFDKVRWEFMKAARQYRLEAINVTQDWKPLGNYLPQHAVYLQTRKSLWALGWIRNAIRSILQRLGILPVVYRAQEKYLKREI